ncbi:MAG: PAS domain-containing protein [Candidatus Vogelbacteria bacterium]
MENNKVNQSKLEKSKELALHYMKTLVEVARESFLILDPNFRVISANEVFYSNFRVKPEQTENRLLYELGNGQWNISELKKLLEKILPEKKVVKDYRVTHIFETIGKKTMMLSARQIDSVQLIILAIEDISDRKKLEEKLAKHIRKQETLIAERTANLADKIKELESVNKSMVGRELKMVELKKEIMTLKQRIKNGNSENGNNNGNHKNGRSK